MWGGGLERALRKQSGGLFLARGRVPSVSDASRRDVDGTEPVRSRKALISALFQKSFLIPLGRDSDPLLHFLLTFGAMWVMLSVVLPVTVGG